MVGVGWVFKPSVSNLPPFLFVIFDAVDEYLAKCFID